MTVLMHAPKNEASMEVVELLLAKGADITAKNRVTSITVAISCSRVTGRSSSTQRRSYFVQYGMTAKTAFVKQGGADREIVELLDAGTYFNLSHFNRN